jgi:hypothetical protein
MRKLMAALFATSMLFGGVACDDNESSGKTGIDEDDTRVGPGDGKDETGPGR